MDFSNYLDANFWFNAIPTPKINYLWPMLILGVLIFIAIALIIFLKGEPKRFFGKFATPCMAVGILGYVHLLARHEGLPFLSARAFMGGLILMLVIWSIVIVFWIVRTWPKYKTVKSVNERFEKYLPKSKKAKA
jgi:hypothetical protein